MKKLVVIILVCISLFSCTNKKCHLALGDLLVDEAKVVNYFAMEKMDSQTMYRIISSDALECTNNKRLSSYIKQTKSLLISIGLYDLLSSLKVVNGKAIYDNETVNNRLELFSYYLDQSLDDIIGINSKVKIYVFSLYNPFYCNDDSLDMVDNFIDEFNDEIIEVTSYYHINYIDITFLNNYLEKSFKLTETGKERLNEIIKETI